MYFLLQPSYSQLNIFLLSLSWSGSTTVESGRGCCTEAFWEDEDGEEETDEDEEEDDI